jgi:hypothetical protein
MELLFVFLIAIGLGALARYASGAGRDTYGYLLVPAISAVVSAVVWEVMLWIGFTFDGGWIWVVSLVLGPFSALIVALRLPIGRRADDRAMLTKLSGGLA